jgi:hypothetical protein
MELLSFLNALVIVTLVARLLLSPVPRKLFRSTVYSRVETTRIFILEHYFASKLVAAVGEACRTAEEDNNIDVTCKLKNAIVVRIAF